MSPPALVIAEHRLRNTMHTLALLASMAGLTATLGWFIGGPVWALGTLLFGVFAMFATTRMRPTNALQLVRARPLKRTTAPGLHAILDQLVSRARLPARPALFYISSPIPNAVSVGTVRQPVVAVTDGLLRQLTARQIAGVLAHELGHIKNGDLLVMTLADTFGRFTSLFGHIGLLLLVFGWCTLRLETLPLAFLLALSPVLSTLLMLALSRQREFAADLTAVEITQDPESLASALRRLDHPVTFWTRLLGLPGRDANPSVLRTHPAIEERIDRLRSLVPHPPRRDAQEPIVVHLPPIRVFRTQWPWESWL